MRAAVYRGVDEVRLEEIPRPEPGRGEILVRVAACGVCGTDIKKIHYGLQPPPRVFGHETAGTIAAVGADVAGWQVGERVALYHHVPCRECHFCARGAYAQCETYKRTGITAGFEPAGGGFAEYVRVMEWIVSLGGVVRIPDGASFEEATFLEPANTCLKAVRRAGIRQGDTVLVCGQGAIGLLLMQLARREGAVVVTSDPIPERRALSLELGAVTAIDPLAEDVAALTRRHSNGRGADAALLAATGSALVAQAMDAVRPGGKVLLFANTRSGDRIEVDAGVVCALEKDLIGSYSSSVELNEEVERVIFGREIEVRRLVTHRFPLERTWEAICRAGEPSANALKVMVLPDSGATDR